jgi:hypothetical protein
LATRREGGRLRTTAIDIELKLNFENIHKIATKIKRALDRTKLPLDEYWILVSRQFTNIVAAPALDSRIKIYEIEELRNQLRGALALSKSSRARTKIGQAVEVNESEIVLAVSGLILQIDEKLEQLGSERPNSDDAKAKVASEISDLEGMKAELQRIRELVAGFKKSETPEKEIVKSVNTFSDDLQGWWNKSHDSLLTATAKSALFVSSAGVLALMGANTPAALAIVGVLIGGKVIKKIKKVGKKVPGAIQ